MKRTQYRLTLENPCHQDWSAMTPAEGGKFCAHCAKTVLDFTGLSDREVVRIIEKKKSNFCGRLDPSQLNRVLIEPGGSSPFSRFYHFFASLLFFGTAREVSYGQQVEKQPVVQTNADWNVSSIEPLTSRPAKLGRDSSRVVEGVITDAETQKPVRGASLFVRGSTKGIGTDQNGYYRLFIPENLSSDSVTLDVWGIGYYDVEIKVSLKELPFQKDIQLIKNPDDVVKVISGGGICVKKKHWWQFWKRF